ncbi:MAG: glycosyltransferase [Candidatus Eremiobacteraeota bacterium]|nr:glycosyltransferase [Candidatus Eremiobacteraeota bacterium]
MMEIQGISSPLPPLGPGTRAEIRGDGAPAAGGPESSLQDTVEMGSTVAPGTAGMESLPKKLEQQIKESLALHPWKKVKVFLVHGSHTGGHASAARSVEKVLKSIPGVEVQNINTLNLSASGVMTGQVAAFNMITRYMAGLRSWAFRKSFEGSGPVYALGNLGMKMKSFLSKKFLTKIQQEKPDIILSTHSPMNSMLSYWKEKGLIDQPVHSVVTDFGAHRMWAQKNIERYYVATGEVKADLERFGVAPEKIEITGIPIDPSFAGPSGLSQAELKEKLGLDPSLPVVLMAGGSLGYGNFSGIARALDGLGRPLQIVAITGKNAEKKRELEELTPDLKSPMKVLPYVDTMSEWMKASDVIISKPGGLTTSEIFAMKKPMILITPLPGLEELLIPKITDTGCAVLAGDENEAAALAGKIITDEKYRGDLQEHLKKVGMPYAAYTVSAGLVERALQQ